jgi:hypothetical protein
MGKLISVLRKFLGWFSGAGEKTAQVIQKIAVEALPVVEVIALMTPTRIDDEIILLFRRFAVKNAEWFLMLPQEERGLALLYVATKQLQRQFPGVPVNILQAAIQLALAQYRQKDNETSLAAVTV